MIGAKVGASATRSLLGVWALFLAMAFLQVGNGIQRVLLPIRAGSEGFGAGSMGAVMAFHFAGFLIGTKDEAVDLSVAYRLLDRAEGGDIRLTLVKGKDHRFSDPECMELIKQAILEVSGS